MHDIKKHKDIILISFIIILIAFIVLINYIIDPYYIFHYKTIKGINQEKTYRYANKRTNIYSTIKLLSKGKEIIFSGNCLLYDDGTFKNNIAFYTIPVAKIDEVSNLILNIHKINPKIKKIYWGLFYDDFYNEKTNEVTDSLPKNTGKYLSVNDFTNLFFSWNTTKYSLLTIKDSIKNRNETKKFIYPYREIANKKYEKSFSFENLNKIAEIKKYCQDNNVELIIYYSPIHISKKVDLFLKNQWQNNTDLKKKLADITDYYDYSLNNEYNSTPLDKKNKFYIDNIHPSSLLNNILVNDLSEKKEHAILVTKKNADFVFKKDTKNLKEYIAKNKIQGLNDSAFTNYKIELIEK